MDTRERCAKLLAANDTEAWARFLASNPSPDLRDFRIKGIATTNPVQFKGCDLKGAEFRRCTLQHADFSGALLDGAVFVESDLSHCHFNDSKCGVDSEPPRFQKCKLFNARFSGCSLPGVRLHHVDATRAHFTGANLNGSRIIDVVANNTDFSTAQLKAARLERVQLEAAKLISADLTDASFQDVSVNDETNLAKAKVTRCEIHRRMLDSLSNFGNLTVAQRSSMVIRDDVAKLQMSYSGASKWIHLIALATFLFPYGFFIVYHWALAHIPHLPSNGTEAITLLEALLRYVYSGPLWREGFIFNAATVYAIIGAIYNVARFWLLRVTTRLELQQAITGLPADFSLDRGFVKWVYRIGRYAFYVYLSAVMFNTILFMQQQVLI